MIEEISIEFYRNVWIKIDSDGWKITMYYKV